jgi:glycosyltransferase involved in cell wall biosynthesis
MEVIRFQMARSLNVLNVLDYCPPFYGGFGVHLDSLGDDLQERGHFLHLAFPRTRDWFDHASRHAASVRVIPSIHRPIQNGFAPELRNLVRQEHVDVIHLHFSYALALAIALHWPLRVPILYHWHNPPKALLPLDSRHDLGRGSSPRVPDRVSGQVVRQASGFFARIGDTIIRKHIVIGKEIETLLLRSRWTQPDKIVHLPNGLPTLPQKIADWREHPRPFVLGSVANFREQKDHPTLLRAFARCVAEDPGLRLDLVGDGPTRSRIHRLARELGIESRVRFLGYLDDPSWVYCQMDAFVHSTHYEGQGLVILEAMAHALPVIATDLPCIREMLPNLDYGLLVPPRDANALAASILKVVREPHLRKILAVRSRAEALGARSPRQWAQTLANLYESVIPT